MFKLLLLHYSHLITSNKIPTDSFPLLVAPAIENFLFLFLELVSWETKKSNSALTNFVCDTQFPSTPKTSSFLKGLD